LQVRVNTYVQKIVLCKSLCLSEKILVLTEKKKILVLAHLFVKVP